MTQLERYIFLIKYWQSKLIQFKAQHEQAEKQLAFYTQKRIEFEKNNSENK